MRSIKVVLYTDRNKDHTFSWCISEKEYNEDIDQLYVRGRKTYAIASCALSQGYKWCNENGFDVVKLITDPKPCPLCGYTMHKDTEGVYECEKCAHTD